jgi:hypothetical protein
VAEAPRGPATTAQRTGRPRGTQAAPSTAARTTTAGIDTAWVAASGHSPAPSGTCPSAANSTPKPRPARIPSSNPARAGAGVRSSAGTLATHQIPGSATAMPSHTSSAGRSPPSSPASTGTTAAPTAETGATTLIRPVEKPR